MLYGEQIRAARALARMDQAALAEVSGVSLPTIKRLERVDEKEPLRPISANTRTEDAIRRAFADVGVMFIDLDGMGPGVRLVKPAT
jgi:transcriptional regulator with XRE-family HTH domain